MEAIAGTERHGGNGRGRGGARGRGRSLRLRAVPERHLRHRGRDGAHRLPHHLFRRAARQHGLLHRAHRRRRPPDRAGAHAAGPPRLGADGHRIGAPPLRRRHPPRRHLRDERPVRRRHAPAGHLHLQAGVRGRRAARLRRDRLPPRRCRRPRRGLQRLRFHRDLPGGRAHPAAPPLRARRSATRPSSRCSRRTCGSRSSSSATSAPSSPRATSPSASSSSSSRQHGAPATRFYLREIIDYAERLTRAALRELPDGETSFEDWIDDDGVDRGKPIRLFVTLRKEGGSLHADWAGSSPQVKGAINSTLSWTKAATYTAIRSVLPAGHPQQRGRLPRHHRLRAPRHHHQRRAACGLRRPRAHRLPHGGLRLRGARHDAAGEGFRGLRRRQHRHHHRRLRRRAKSPSSTSISPAAPGARGPGPTASTATPTSSPTWPRSRWR